MRMSERLLAFVDGDLVPLGEARVSVLDEGFRIGLGVFETIRCYGTHPFRLAAHVERARAGAVRLGFEPPPVDVLADAIRRTAVANARDGDLVARLTLTAGALDADLPWPSRRLNVPTVVVTVHPLNLPMHTSGISAQTVLTARELPDVKAVSYLAATLARQEAHAAGADEALLVCADGRVTEGASSNLFLVRNGTVTTPPLAGDILPGITRQVVLEVAATTGTPLVEADMRMPDVVAADEAFVTSSTRELVPLVRVDGQPVGSGQPGPVTERLLAAYRDVVERERGT
jgi:branched-subunit amino acid aminotransferase/4-amino-4-deoxychorismate lyase